MKKKNKMNYGQQSTTWDTYTLALNSLSATVQIDQRLIKTNNAAEVLLLPWEQTFQTIGKPSSLPEHPRKLVPLPPPQAFVSSFSCPFCWGLDWPTCRMSDRISSRQCCVWGTQQWGHEEQCHYKNEVLLSVNAHPHALCLVVINNCSWKQSMLFLSIYDFELWVVPYRCNPSLSCIIDNKGESNHTEGVLRDQNKLTKWLK